MKDSQIRIMMIFAKKISEPLGTRSRRSTRMRTLPAKIASLMASLAKKRGKALRQAANYRTMVQRNKGRGMMTKRGHSSAKWASLQRSRKLKARKRSPSKSLRKMEEVGERAYALPLIVCKDVTLSRTPLLKFLKGWLLGVLSPLHVKG